MRWRSHLGGGGTGLLTLKHNPWACFGPWYGSWPRITTLTWGKRQDCDSKCNSSENDFVWLCPLLLYSFCLEDNLLNANQLGQSYVTYIINVTHLCPGEDVFDRWIHCGAFPIFRHKIHQLYAFQIEIVSKTLFSMTETQLCAWS